MLKNTDTMSDKEQAPDMQTNPEKWIWNDIQMTHFRTSLHWVVSELDVMATNSDCKEERDKLSNMAKLVNTSVSVITDMERQQIVMARAIEKLKKINKK